MTSASLCTRLLGCSLLRGCAATMPPEPAILDLALDATSEPCMSVSNYRSRVEQLERELAQLLKKQSDETRKEAEIGDKIAQRMARSATTALAQQTKMREVAALQAELSRTQRAHADALSRVNSKRQELHRAQADLSREQEREQKKASDEAERRRRSEQEAYEREQKKRADADRRRKSEQDSYLRQVQAALKQTKTAAPVPRSTPSSDDQSHDLFICHASEDKDDLVRPLAEALITMGLRVWYDEFQLRVGDSLRESIDRGLRSSRYGVVVLSSAFFAKNWTQYELNGLVAREMTGSKVVLPIWHKVTKDEILGQSPPLADKVALNTSILSIQEIARDLHDVVKLN